MVINNIKIKTVKKNAQIKQSSVKTKTGKKPAVKAVAKKRLLKKGKQPALSLKEAVDKALTPLNGERVEKSETVVASSADAPLRSKTGPMPLKADVVAIDEAKNIVKNKAPLNRQAIKQAVLAELAIDRSLLKPSTKIQSRPTPLPVKDEIKKDKPKVKPLKTTPKEELKIPESESITEALLIKPNKGLRAAFIVKGIVLAIIFLLVLLTASVYFGSATSGFNLSVAAALPYPALVVNKQPILLADFQKDLIALEKYFKRQNFPYQTSALKQSVLKSLTEKAIIAQLALAENIIISETAISDQLNSIKSEETAPGAMAEMIKELYGWSVEDYGQKVIKPLLLAKKLAESFKVKSGDIAKKDKLQQYLAELETDEDKFAVMAAEINEDDSKLTEGDLGWMDLGESAPEFEAIYLNLKEGEIAAEVVETSNGYHIVKLIDRAADSNGLVSYHVAHLFLKKSSFADYLNQEISKAKIISLIK